MEPQKTVLLVLMLVLGLTSAIDFYRYRQLTSPGFLLSSFTLLFIAFFSFQTPGYIRANYLYDFYLDPLFCSLSFIALTFTRPKSAKDILILNWSNQFIKLRIVLVISSMLSLAGVLGTITTPEEIRSIGQQRGLITIYYFLASFGKIGLISFILLRANQHKFSRVEKIALIAISFYYLDFILFQGKRTGVYELLVSYLLLSKGQFSFKKIALVSALSFSLFTLSVFVHEYRLITKHGYEISSVSSSVKSDEVLIGPVVEIEHAIYQQAANNTAGENLINFSKVWNNVVAVLVPGQLVGYAFKESLILDDGYVDTRLVGYSKPTGAAAFFTSELYVFSPFFGPILLFIILVCVSLLSRSKKVLAKVIQLSFLFAIPYLISFGFFGFVFYMIRIFIVFGILILWVNVSHKNLVEDSLCRQ